MIHALRTMRWDLMPIAMQRRTVSLLHLLALMAGVVSLTCFVLGLLLIKGGINLLFEMLAALLVAVLLLALRDLRKGII